MSMYDFPEIGKSLEFVNASNNGGILATIRGVRRWPEMLPGSSGRSLDGISIVNS